MEKSRITAIWKRVDRFSTVFLLTVLLIQISYFASYKMTEDPFQDELLGFNPPTVVGVALVLPLFYCLVKTVVLFDEMQRNLFYEKSMELHTLGERCRFFLCNIRFWIEEAVFSLLYWVLPLKWFCMPIVNQFTTGTPNLTDKAVLFVILFPIMSLINLVARLSCMNKWKTTRYKVGQKRMDYTEKEFNEQITVIGIVFCSLGCFLPTVIPFVVFILMPLFEEIINIVDQPAVLSVLIAGVAAWILYIAIRAYFKRRTFITELQKICAEKGYTLSTISRPYLSVWLFSQGESFSIGINGSVYSCKLIGGVRRFVKMILFANGQGCLVYPLRFLKSEIMRYESWFNFGYESKNKQILIINPVPFKVWLQTQGKLLLLDNGDQVGNFSMYAGSAFLNSVRRGDLDKQM